MAELFANLKQTTLLSNYTVGDGSIHVASTAGFPAMVSGDTIHITIYDQVTKLPKLILKAIAKPDATHFTTVPEGTDANCSTGDVLRGTVVSQEVMEDIYAAIAAVSGGGGGGGYIGTPLFIQTDESTTSTSDVSLTTPDAITFVLTATTDLLVEYMAQTYSTVSVGQNFSALYLDGVPVPTTNAFQASPDFGHQIESTFVAQIVPAVPAGSHTVEIKHRTSSGTGDWWNRSLKITAATAALVVSGGPVNPPPPAASWSQLGQTSGTVLANMANGSVRFACDASSAAISGAMLPFAGPKSFRAALHGAIGATQVGVFFYNSSNGRLILMHFAGSPAHPWNITVSTWHIAGGVFTFDGVILGSTDWPFYGNLVLWLKDDGTNLSGGIGSSCEFDGIVAFTTTRAAWLGTPDNAGVHSGGAAPGFDFEIVEQKTA